MLQDYALDDREDLRFKGTNPAVDRLLREKFESVPLRTLPRDMLLLHRMAPRE